MHLLTRLLSFVIIFIDFDFCFATKLIIDTDGAFDDIRALTIALTHPNAEILAITTTHGSVSPEQAAINVDRIMRATGQTSIPLFIGSNDSLIPKGPVQVWEAVYGFDGLGGVPNVWPAAQNISKVGANSMSAIDAIIGIVKTEPEVTLVCIGPLTNLARVIQKEPEIVKRLSKVIIMGGNYLAIGNTQTNSTAEFNFLMDPEAAQIVLSNIHTMIVPWDTCFLKGPQYRHLVDYEESLRQNTNLSNFLKSITQKSREFSEEHGQYYAFIDDIAVAIGIEAEIAEWTQRLYANVELRNDAVTRGQVAIDWLSAAYDEKKEQFEADKVKNDNNWLAQTFVTKYNVREINRLLLTAVGAQKNSSRNARNELLIRVVPFLFLLIMNFPI